MIIGNEKADPGSFDEIVTKHCILWREIGLKLGLKSSVLDIIDADNPNDQKKRLSKTLDAWIKQDQDKATWGVLELAITNANRAQLALPLLSYLDTGKEYVFAFSSTKCIFQMMKLNFICTVPCVVYISWNFTEWYIHALY